MALELHVRGEITYGQLAHFTQAVQVWCAYRAEHGWVVPRVLFGLSGPMNHVLMIFVYADATQLEAEEGTAAADPQYAKVAGDLGFREPSVVQEMYRPASTE